MPVCVDATTLATLRQSLAILDEMLASPQVLAAAGAAAQPSCNGQFAQQQPQVGPRPQPENVVVDVAECLVEGDRFTPKERWLIVAAEAQGALLRMGLGTVKTVAEVSREAGEHATALSAEADRLFAADGTRRPPF